VYLDEMDRIRKDIFYIVLQSVLRISQGWKNLWTITLNKNLFLCHNYCYFISSEVKICTINSTCIQQCPYQTHFKIHKHYTWVRTHKHTYEENICTYTYLNT
jgi:hypothetical protein